MQDRYLQDFKNKQNGRLAEDAKAAKSSGP
jgi:hypothetical protein